MMDYLFTIASCAARQDLILQLDFSDVEKYSIRKWLGINHAMRTIDFATEHFPLPPLQQVQVSIKTCKHFKKKMNNF
jgi:hypothetical protein